jgi:uncharacterized protein with beta-barrel porin domain
MYVGKNFNLGPGSLQVLLGGTLGWHDLDSEREVLLGGQGQRLKADYHAKSYEISLDTTYLRPLFWGAR